MKRALAVVGALAVTASLHGQAPASTASRTRQHVTTLASDEFDGRMSGSAGETRASNYLVAQLQRIGAKPLPGRTSFTIPFEFTAGTRDGGSWVRLGGTAAGRYEQRTDIQALSFSDNADVSNAPVVFAGYGIVVPDSQNFPYDSYATLDVKDKVVLVLRYFPEDAEPKTKGILARYADLRYKAMAARQRGAKAMLVVAGPHSPNAGETIPMSFDTALAGSGIVAASISGAVATSMFRTLGDPAKTLDAAQKSLDDANPHATGFALPNLEVSIHTDVVREKKTGNNVVGYLPATGTAAPVQKPWVAVGAHYDHLGHGENGNSLAEKADVGRIHHGADDNASGTAAVLALGELLAAQPRTRNVLLQFWSGEELGLIGSNAYVNAPPLPLDQLAAYVNFDMVGRMQDNKLTVQATGSSPVWARVVEQANIAGGFDLQVQQDPYQPTDVSSFNQAGVPSLALFTGTHTDYHKPSDTADKINYEDLDRVVQFAAAIVKRIGDTPDAPQFTKVEQTSDAGSRAGVRLFTGTIPDYSTEVKGLLLSGVIGGGPAEQAGLQKGDVIVEIAGQTIANIYDYTYALEVLKIGEPVKVVYQRNGERRETTLTPGARK
ncbi:MAG TPA: M20/M25/M40 family metallo-hydrolase [Vicinamibacterales bacterium]|nr:M20/M25/M40 family metallo-hydrolase [Vicinamibacterales bacterium]